ncbi:hypothetical protein FHG87_000757 [Trinorchestia longiramus]|nr:hypothetical protein FHG87_000757 [Trinorchestia longiramus]
MSQKSLTCDLEGGLPTYREREKRPQIVASISSFSPSWMNTTTGQQPFTQSDSDQQAVKLSGRCLWSQQGKVKNTTAAQLAMAVLLLLITRPTRTAAACHRIIRIHRFFKFPAMGRIENSATTWTWCMCCFCCFLGIFPGIFAFYCCFRKPKCTICGYEY